MKYLTRECPRFNECSVNNCPLELMYPNMIVLDEDKEKTCTMEKQVRYKIGSKYPEILKFQGLTPKEWAAKKRYESLTYEEKQILAKRGKEALLKIKKVKKGI